jgi:hypothetical protein
MPQPHEPRKKSNAWLIILLLVGLPALFCLAGVVAFGFVNSTNTGSESACKADRRALELASEAYRAQKGGYPGSVEPDLVPASNSDANSDARILILKNRGYIREAPPESDYVLWLNSDGSVTKNAGPSGC